MSLIYAHRGASGYAPENTLEAFELAAKMGADGVELDVQMTKDGEIVVAHDEGLSRVSNGFGLIHDMTLAQLKKLYFNKTHPEYARATIPTLREVYELLKPTGLRVNTELKNLRPIYDDFEEKCVKIAYETGMTDRVMYSSFNYKSLARIKQLDPSIQVGILKLPMTVVSRIPTKIAGNITKGVSDAIPAELSDRISGAASDLSERISSAASGFADGLSGAASHLTTRISNAASGFADGISGAASDLTGRISNAASGFADGISGAASDLTGRISNAAPDLTGHISNAASGFTDGISGAASDLTGRISDAVPSDITERISKVIPAALTECISCAIPGNLSDILGLFGEVPDSVVDEVRTVGRCDILEFARKKGIDAIHPHISELPALIGKARAMGIQLNVWTTNSEEDIRMCLLTGVNSIIGDYPDRMFKLRESAAFKGPQI